MVSHECHIRVACICAYNCIIAIMKKLEKLITQNSCIWNTETVSPRKHKLTQIIHSWWNRLVCAIHAASNVQAFVVLFFCDMILFCFILCLGCLIPHIVFISRNSGEYIQLENLYGGIMGTQTCVTWHLTWKTQNLLWSLDRYLI